MTIHAKEIDRNLSWDKATGKWKVKVRDTFLGRFVDRQAAREARDAFLASQPTLAPRQSTNDTQLRMRALSTARVQFAAASPDALIQAAEQLYAWLKSGTKAVSTNNRARYDRVEALRARGMHLFTACEQAGLDYFDYEALHQEVLATHHPTKNTHCY